MHELFTRLGYDIVCEPTVGNGRKIDFLLRRGASAFYLEATIARKSVTEQAADSRRNRIYRELDKIKSNNSMLGITIESAGGSEMRNIGTLRARLEEWLATLDPDEAERKWDTDGEGPTLHWTDDNGWSLVFEAFPSKPEFPGQPVSRALGMFMYETGGLIEMRSLCVVPSAASGPVDTEISHCPTSSRSTRSPSTLATKSLV